MTTSWSFETKQIHAGPVVVLTTHSQFIPQEQEATGVKPGLVRLSVRSVSGVSLSLVPSAAKRVLYFPS
jgi:O-acetylhomoserine/O-acetylserine sulfhydrylase-like pyridoxal-dependent enzyme